MSKLTVDMITESTFPKKGLINANWDIYNETINFDNIPKHDRNIYESKITNTILEAAKTAIPFSETNPKRKFPWWTVDE